MIHRPKIWLWIATATMVVSLLLIVIVRPNFGIDFTGGSLLEISTAADPTEVRQLLAGQIDLKAQVSATQSGSVIIKTIPLTEDQHQEVVQVLQDAELLTEELRFESIGPTIGAELRRKSGVAIGAAVIAIIAYLAYTFRQAGGLISSWKFGVAAVVALIHDLLVVTALFVILGRVAGATVDTLFITAMLAILGYSVNDTIVLFNRLKEEWLATRTGDLTSVMNRAIRLTLVRSLNTSLTTLLVLITLLLFGGETLRWFVVALAAGTIAGTYSSLLVAPPFLYLLAKRS